MRARQAEFGLRWVRGLQAVRWRTEDGSASLEFITVGLVLLVPLVYLVIAIAGIQAGALAAEGAARHAARIWVLSADGASAEAALERSVADALGDHGIDRDASSAAVSCADAPTCLAPGARVTVHVHVDVTLPLVPAVLGFDRALTVPIDARAVQTVSRFHPEES